MTWLLCHMGAGGYALRLDKGTGADEHYPNPRFLLEVSRLQPGPQCNRIFSVWELLWVLFARLLFPLPHLTRSSYLFDSSTKTGQCYGCFGYSSEQSKLQAISQRIEVLSRGIMGSGNRRKY
jgi:hypothetical protein